MTQTATLKAEISSLRLSIESIKTSRPLNSNPQAVEFKAASSSRKMSPENLPVKIIAPFSKGIVVKAVVVAEKVPSNLSPFIKEIIFVPTEIQTEIYKKRIKALEAELSLLKAKK